jgi:hypothetical protein
VVCWTDALVLIRAQGIEGVACEIAPFSRVQSCCGLAAFLPSLSDITTFGIRVWNSSLVLLFLLLGMWAGYSAVGVPPVVRAALAWAEAVRLIRDGHVPDAVYDAVRQHFTPKELPI